MLRKLKKVTFYRDFKFSFIPLLSSVAFGFWLSCGKSVKYRFIEFFVVDDLIYFLCFSGQGLLFL